MSPLHLPDVSEFQPNVEWKDVAARNGGAAIIRAMYGTGHVDAAWYGGARRKSAHEAGIQVLGIYQYLVQSEDAVAQAQAFCNLVGSLQPGEFAVLDLEEGAGDQLPRAQAWLEHVDQHLTYHGYNGAWLYSGAAFFEEHGLMPVADSKRHTWVAAYQSSPPGVPHTLWQYTDSAEWPGIGKCDSSLFNGDIHALKAAVGG
ncbi:MAG TPA: glycoside hydrolase family 25 protein [Solirubrobacteraceae bacterium]|jgi:GH25 family lysozyme M1 (1,4-beta-N-acetylmuramidase)